MSKKQTKLKKFRITEHYSDLCFFKKIVEIEAKDEEHAEKLYYEGDGDYIEIMDEIFEQKNDPQWNEIQEIEEIE